jgi:ubiquinone/menaquinone biosynthesis C-methylase UbiE
MTSEAKKHFKWLSFYHKVRGIMSNPSFPETADIETSSDQYAKRFSGVAGEWMLEVQEKTTLSLIADLKPGSALDVGGGHGQITMPLCREGFKVDVIGSDESCSKRIRKVIEEGNCTFQVGDVIKLPFDDNSFPLVVAFRLLTHCTQWQKLISELCRVSSQTVVVDYPTSQSMNAIAPALFKAKKKLEKDTRTWRLFRHREVTDAFADCDFKRKVSRAQFFWPMVLHRAIKSRTLSVFLEAGPRILGLTGLAGSPVITRFDKD